MFRSVMQVAVGLCVFSSTYAAEFDLYFLGGQSNMVGFGKVAELPEDLSGKVDGAFIFHCPSSPDQTEVNNQGSWARFQPGHGTGFQVSNGINKHSDRFGLEVTLIHELKARNPNRKIAVIKYARNGSSIAASAAGRFGCWEPDFHADEGLFRNINQYDHCLATIRAALRNQDIDRDGEIDTLVPVGIAWMQGESDATLDESTAKAYAENLKRLMDLLRAALHADDLPVVVGRISDSGNHPSGNVWKFGHIVRKEQQDFVDHDQYAGLVTSTDQYKYSDPWHYDTAGYIDLGRQFAKAFHNLRADH